MVWPGAFLSLEGLDGTGKTTQLDRLEARLRSEGLNVVRAQEPGGTAIGAEIRRILLDPARTDIDPRTELMLYFAARAQNLREVIRPALERGDIVLTDRFTDATVAYQGYGRELGRGAVALAEAAACEGARPDLTLYLRFDPEVAVRRALERAGAAAAETRFENEPAAFRARVERGYEDLLAAYPERIRAVDASGSIEDVQERVWSEVSAFLERRGTR